MVWISNPNFQKRTISNKKYKNKGNGSLCFDLTLRIWILSFTPFYISLLPLSISLLISLTLLIIFKFFIEEIEIKRETERKERDQFHFLKSYYRCLHIIVVSGIDIYVGALENTITCPM
jgi:hypothetical protein